MIEAVVTVAETDQITGAKGPYLKVKTFDGDGKQWTYNIFEQGDWNMWQPNAVLKIEYEISGNFRNIKTAEVVTEKDLPKPTPEKSPTVATNQAPAPQELGMWWKELGEWLRLWYGHKDQPQNYQLLKECYFAQLFSVLPIKSSKNKEE